jgi:hypothetical protein
MFAVAVFFFVLSGVLALVLVGYHFFGSNPVVLARRANNALYALKREVTAEKQAGIIGRFRSELMASAVSRSNLLIEILEKIDETGLVSREQLVEIGNLTTLIERDLDSLRSLRERAEDFSLSVDRLLVSGANMFVAMSRQVSEHDSEAADTLSKRAKMLTGFRAITAEKPEASMLFAVSSLARVEAIFEDSDYRRLNDEIAAIANRLSGSFRDEIASCRVLSVLHRLSGTCDRLTDQVRMTCEIVDGKRHFRRFRPAIKKMRRGYEKLIRVARDLSGMLN